MIFSIVTCTFCSSTGNVKINCKQVGNWDVCMLWGEDDPSHKVKLPSLYGFQLLRFWSKIVAHHRHVAKHPASYAVGWKNGLKAQGMVICVIGTCFTLTYYLPYVIVYPILCFALFPRFSIALHAKCPTFSTFQSWLKI